jgi:GNAT superfamily N-acetyltransferase
MTPLLRTATEEDLRFVKASWKTDAWKSSSAGKRMSHRVFSDGMDTRIARLIPRSTVYVAAFAEVPDEVLGWACIQSTPMGAALHYVYVKAAFRRHGIAKGLTIDRVRWYTHQTNEAGRAFMESVKAQYNPFLVET